MPESVVSSESVCACPRVIQVMLEKEQGSFGFTVRGGACQEEPARSRPLTITHVRPGGPTDREGTVKAGDRLLAVDGVRLTHATLAEAHRALTAVQRQAVLTIEYDVSVMDAMRARTGPLQVTLEWPPGGLLGLALSSAGAAIVIESIRQASVAERVGVLHVGDQVLAIDDVGLEHMSAAEASRLLQSCAGPELRLQIIPVTARRLSDAKRCKATLPPSLQTASSALSTSSCGSGSYNTLGSVYRRRQPGRTARKHRGHGDGSSAAGSRQETGGGQYSTTGGGTTLCHQESTTLTLLSDSHGFGLALTTRSDSDGQTPPVIGHIEPGSPADRCGILHVGDRLLEVNHQPVDELSADQASRLLSDARPRAVLTVEFDVADAVVPSSGTFLVKLVKRAPSLGLTVAAPKSRQLGEPLIVADVEPGSVAHRNGTIEPGDRLLSIDGVPVDRLTVQQASERLHTSGDIVTLRVQKDNLWADTADPSRVVFTVELERHGGPLGLTISGTEEPFDPVFISGLTDGGLAERTGALHVGDRVLAINGSSLRGRPLSEAIQLLQNSTDVVRLKVARGAVNRRGSLSSASLSTSGCRDPPRPPGSALASVDSAVESWDSAAAAAAELPRLRLAPAGSVSGSGSDCIDGAKTAADSGCDRDSGGAGGERWETQAQRLAAGRPQSAQGDDTEAEEDWNKVLSDLEEVESFRRDFEDQRLDDGAGRRPAGGSGSGSGAGSLCGSRAVSVKPPRLPNWTTEVSAGLHPQSESELAERRLAAGSLCRPREEARGTASAPEFRLPGSYTALSRDSRHLVPVQVHRVTLFKDPVYEDFGFSLSNALYVKGVFVARVKPGGPADKSGILRPYDRILQVS
ncbi:Glutamate receptor-interacting protein 1 [Amphibalanus amphitrite]|uniref:Glutamate receptor-interacting protein 1 n=1 Tax=Amphibalanus amphitrite TaxID=1232801 RepID=A0A6A4XDY4_AMPAM|nr:Glutamate receptor-interacting protein 1 [Amphibalanus amphitrite]